MNLGAVKNYARERYDAIVNSGHVVNVRSKLDDLVNSKYVATPLRLATTGTAESARIARTVGNQLKYVFYGKWNYVVALPLAAATASSYYDGNPGEGIEATIVSLVSLSIIGRIHERLARGKEGHQQEIDFLKEMRQQYPPIPFEELAEKARRKLETIARMSDAEAKEELLRIYSGLAVIPASIEKASREGI